MKKEKITKETWILIGLGFPYVVHLVLLLSMQEKLSIENYTQHPASFTRAFNFIRHAVVISFVTGFGIASVFIFSLSRSSLNGRNFFRLTVWILALLVQCLGLLIWHFVLYKRIGGVF